MYKLYYRPLRHLFACLFLLFFISCQPSPPEQKEEFEGLFYPAQDLGELFHEVQMQQIFEDGKTFVDYIPKYDPEYILSQYDIQKSDPSFVLKEFVNANFERFPEFNLPNFDHSRLTMAEHLEEHWAYLTRVPDEDRVQGSLITLPKPYVVPGGRFREIYYWDSYFTMLGLEVSGKDSLVKSMVDNFKFLIEETNHIPNGNRTYYLSRSQPPFYALMVKLLLTSDKQKLIKDRYLPSLIKEYNYWMKGSAVLNENTKQSERAVFVDNNVLNRYWDDREDPRPESYREDFLLAKGLSDKRKPKLYRDLRAAAESGWDFSSRWFGDRKNLSTIRTTEVLPLDLNCLIFNMESYIAELATHDGDTLTANRFASLAQKRQTAINDIFWNESKGYYADFDIKSGKVSDFISAAMAYPLFFKIADQEKADKVAQIIESKLLKPGGMVTTLQNTGEQWDSPNGWAPLQWMAIKGLLNYGHEELAIEIAKRWISLNRKVYQETGKMMEKYNVVNLNLEAGGGEYPTQDGFGWTNGVALKILATFPELKEEGQN